MANFNRVILAGNLTRDPELRYLQSGTALTKFGIAVNRTYVAGNEKRTDVSFFDITVWGKRAETINKYFAKGKPILLEGRLEQERWEGKDGKQCSRVIVVMENFEFLNPSPKREEGTVEDTSEGTDLPEQI